VGSMEKFRAREGDFVETREGLIFDVKGLIHPPDRLVAYIRYFPAKSGDRRRGGTFYKKVYSLKERDEFLRKEYPQYLYYDEAFSRWLEGVPIQDISKHHIPTVKLLALLEKKDVGPPESHAIKFARGLHDSSGVPIQKMGVSGSILVDLSTETSDIDLIIYGKANCLSVHRALRKLLENNEDVSPYDLEDLKRLYGFRVKDTEMSFEDFVKVERRKVYQGKFLGKDYFIRFVFDWEEVEERYGDRRYVPLGRAKIEATVEDDSKAIFTPCTYVVSDARFLGKSSFPQIGEIASFRGRFCEQAVRGEKTVAQGAVEKVIENDGRTYYRLILGEYPSDFMAVKGN